MTVQEELKLNDQGPSGLQEALKQVATSQTVLRFSPYSVVLFETF